MSDTAYFYRVEETTYSAGVDEFGDPLPGGPTRTNLLIFRVLKTTPCGAWIEAGFGGRRFVNLKASKRFALPTVDEAVASYRARKARQVRILTAQIKRVHEAIAYLDAEGFYIDCREWVR